MGARFIAVIKKVHKFVPEVSPTEHVLTSFELLGANGHDCGVPLYVRGFEEASELLMKAGVTLQELREKVHLFDKGAEVRISLVADNEVIEEMGFEPVDPKSDQVDS
jgi:hypothetical protein